MLKSLCRRIQLPLRGMVLAFLLWTSGAVYFLLPAVLWLRECGAIALILCGYGFLRRSSSWNRWLAGTTVVCTLICCVHFLKPADNNRQWASDNARLPEVLVDGDDITIRDFRRCRYRTETDFDVAYDNIQFSLADLKRVWFVVQRFTTLEGIAHNFLTFAIDEDQRTRYITVSIEIRREAHEVFSPVKGMYREFEIIYVLADERDQIGARTVFRPNDRVFLFPVNVTESQVQQLFLDITARVNELRVEPEFYNSFTNNCTNNIVVHTYPLTEQPFNWLDPRIVAPGFADRFAWSHGLIGKPNQPFADVQREHRIDEIARATGITERLSSQIRRLDDNAGDDNAGTFQAGPRPPATTCVLPRVENTRTLPLHIHSF